MECNASSLPSWLVGLVLSGFALCGDCERWDLLIRHSVVDHRRVNTGRGPLILCVLGETIGKIGEEDEIGERELVLVVSVRCGKECDMTHG